VTTVAMRNPAAPFAADAAFALRMATLTERVGPAVERDVAAVLTGHLADPLDASTVPAATAREIVGRHGLGSIIELALLSLPLARQLANPPISGYRVAAVGIESDSGDLVLGGNLEFPGTELWTTIHAEGFVSLRARRRGRTLATLAVSEAHPCAHCRQTLAESAAANGLEIVDPLGHRLSLLDLYPWPFQPSALGMDGDAPALASWPDLRFGSAPAGAVSQPADVAALLLACGARAHAPYSASPSAAVLRLRDGRLLGAGSVESVSFNPSVSALQAALVELAAARVQTTDIAAAWLAATRAGAVDPEAGFRALLRAVAPAASAHVARWQAGTQATTGDGRG
jgi:cytidine deaminase